MGVLRLSAARLFDAFSQQLARLRSAYVNGGLSERALERAEAQALAVQKRPYETWQDLPQRPAAPSSGSRQNERRSHAMRVIVGDYPGESRSVRRRMARALGRRTWRKRFDLPEPGGARA